MFWHMPLIFQRDPPLYPPPSTGKTSYIFSIAPFVEYYSVCRAQSGNAEGP